MEEGIFVAWLKQDGEAVRAGEPLFTLDGDKALQEIEATDNGILCIPPEAPKPGATVKVGALLGYLMGESEASATTSPRAETPSDKAHESTLITRIRDSVVQPSQAGHPAAPITSAAEHSRGAARYDRRAITPRALRAAAQLGIDWAHIIGSGRGGRIRERDILAAGGGRSETR